MPISSVDAAVRLPVHFARASRLRRCASCPGAGRGASALGAGCTSHPLAAVAPAPELENLEAFPIETSKKIDLLFVVDNSGSMREEQASLALNFPRFMQAIEAQGLPDLQMAVISTDIGAGGIKQDKCAGIGDAGRFKAAGQLSAASRARRHFCSVDREGQKNFDGALTDAFACIATLGIEGCGYEHPLQSLAGRAVEQQPAPGRVPASGRPPGHHHHQRRGRLLGGLRHDLVQRRSCRPGAQPALRDRGPRLWRSAGDRQGHECAAVVLSPCRARRTTTPAGAPA